MSKRDGCPPLAYWLTCAGMAVQGLAGTPQEAKAIRFLRSLARELDVLEAIPTKDVVSAAYLLARNADLGPPGRYAAGYHPFPKTGLRPLLQRFADCDRSGRTKFLWEEFRDEWGAVWKVAGLGSNSPSICSSDPPRFADWALGLSEDNKWVLFQRFGDDWREQKRVTVSKGRQDRLLQTFLKHNGELTKENALKSENVPVRDITEARRALRKIKPEISNLRNAVRQTMGISESADPFPQDGDRGWRAAFPIGYAAKDESGKLRFGTGETMLKA